MQFHTPENYKLMEVALFAILKPRTITQSNKDGNFSVK